MDYVRESCQRVEIYRKLAQVTDSAGIERLRQEMRDRFGPLPIPVDLVLSVAELRVLAAAAQVTALDVVEDKVKITRRGELFTVGGRLPRLTKIEPKARLVELRKLVVAISA